MDFFIKAKEKIKTDKIGLIDADFVRFIVTSSVVKQHEKTPSYLEMNYIPTEVDKALSKVTAHIDAPALLLCFSGSRHLNFRHAVSYEKQYKGNRPQKAQAYPREFSDRIKIENYLKENYPCVIYPELEADDLICMLQDEDTFIYSEDKDLKQVPGTHYDILNDVLIEITKEQAFKNLMEQMLIGDTVDNITGLSGCGPVTCSELLTKTDSNRLQYVVFQAYIQKHGIVAGIDCFVETWNLVKLRMNRGPHFQKKYQGAFELLTLLKKQRK
jgi:hypothetical protein